MQFKRFIMVLGLLCCASAYAAEPSPAHPQVEIQTNHGSFVVELYPERAPKTVTNFLEYVTNNFYPGTIFHRTINHFMIQGGGLTAELKEKTSMAPTSKTALAATQKENLVLPPIPNESNNGLKNERGTLAMARTFESDSATSQFFINLEDNKFLNYYKPDPHYIGYCVFGRVIRGMDVVENISQLPKKSVGQFTNVPQQAVIIEKVALLEKPIETSIESDSPNKSKSSKPASKGKKRG